jgi:spore coat protein SA
MIYHVLTELEPFSAVRGGALSHTVANLMRLDPARTVVCPDADSTWGYGAGRALVVPELRWYARMRARRFYPQWLMKPVFRLVFRGLLRRLKEGDIVWFHSQPTFCAALGPEIRRKGAKTIYHCHDAITKKAAISAMRRCRPDAWIFLSNAQRAEWLPLLPAAINTYVVPNGADETLFFPCADKRRDPTPVILYVGRLHPEKGIQVLMEAMRVLGSRGVRAHCRVVGSSFSGGSRVTPFARSVVRSGPPGVRFAGHRSAREVADEFRAADVLCCPSVCQEPFGKVNVEAMACGLPVVASAVGGIPEIAAGGGILLVKPGDPVELADKLQLLVEDPSLRKRIGAEGLESFRRSFTWGMVLKRYREIAAGTDAISSRKEGEV